MEEPIQVRVLYEDYLQLPEDGNRYEVLEGILMMSPAPGYRHQRVSSNLHYILESWRRSAAFAGRVLAAPFDVVLAEDTIVQPDLIYLRPERTHLIMNDRLQGSPDLAVEIFQAAGASRDRVSKLQIYSRFQIPEYWLVDLDEQSLTILTHTGTGYSVMAKGIGSAPLSSVLLPGLILTPQQVFEE